MWCRPRQLPDAHIHELIEAVSLLCLAVVDLRTPVSGLVTCSDASTSGGGMCASNGLTTDGEALLKQLDVAPYDSECFRPQVFNASKQQGRVCWSSPSMMVPAL